jgi:hypothetical protein
MCANVCTAMYMLSLAGDIVDEGALGNFDPTQQDSLSNSLVGDMPWEQARCKMKDEGLGVKTGAYSSGGGWWRA